MLEEGLIKFLKDNKKYLLIAILIIVIVGIIFFVFPKEEEELLPQQPSLPTTFPDLPLEHNPLTIERCKSVEDPIQKKVCLAELDYINAVLDRDVNECLSLTKDDQKDKCIFEIARTELIKEHCHKIKDKKMKEMCFVDVAIEKLDDSICDYAFSDEPFERKECKDKVRCFDIVRNKKDISLCHEVRTLEYGPLCYGYMFAQGQDCSKVKTGKEICQSMYILGDAKNKEDCNKIPLENYKKVCFAMVEAGGKFIDSDGDGVYDGEELNYTTNPFNTDTDGDGLNDYEEIKNLGTNPTEADTDRDGLNDYEELKIYHTHVQKPDTDGDGWLDGEEVKAGYNPLGEERL